MARPYDTLVPAVERLKKAMQSGASRTEIMEAIVVLAQTGKQLNGKQARKVFTEMFAEVAPSTKSGDLEFAMDALQKAYDKEVRGKMKSFSNALEWFRKSESRVVKDLRRLLTGLDIDDFRHLLNVTGDRMIGAASIVRNAHLPKIAKSFDTLVYAPEHAARLKALLKPFVDSGALERFKKTGMISDLDFWKIKGGITEILSESIKQDYLKEIRKKFPNAELIENVKATTRLTREGKLSGTRSPLQIWDGIIAEIKGSQLIIHAKFEVKSGMQGFKQAMEQILDTFYYRFVSKGDRLHISHNGKQHVFVNSPNASASIKGLDSANVMITPTGKSDVLPNQVLDHGDFDIEYLLLKIDDIEIDHHDIEALVMDLLKSYKP